MSRFNPYEQNTGLYQRLEEFFPDKELMLRSGGVIRHVRISTLVQLFIVVALFASVIWGGYSSAMYFVNNEVIATKQEKIVNTKEAYKSLVADVAAYRNYMNELNKLVVDADNKEKNSKLSKSEAKEKADELKEKRSEIERRIVDLNRRMDDLLDDQGWVKVEDKNLVIEMRKANLERDLAQNEIDELKDKISNMENMITSLKAAQLQVYKRVEGLAENGIDDVYSSLKGLRGTLEKVGISYKDLVKDKTLTGGQGGPFIPSDNADYRDGMVNAAFSSVDKVLKRWHEARDSRDRIPTGSPIATYYITANFGYRVDPFTGRQARHEGLDMAGPIYQPVKATAKGKVTRAGAWGWYGNIVEISHGNGLTTRYAHLSKIKVSVGQTVAKRTVIGLEGSTGRSTGPHVHYEVRVKGKPVNPQYFVQARR